MSSKKRISRRDFTNIAFGTISTMMIKLDIKPFVATTTKLHHPYTNRTPAPLWGLTTR